jgi:hypothetical protein
MQITATLTASALAAGQYQGFIVVSDTSTGSVTRVPYWYAVPSGVPGAISVLNVPPGGSQQVQQSTILFRVTDTSGIAMTNIQPVVTVLSGSAVVGDVSSQDNLIPGAFAISLNSGSRRSTTTSVLRIQVGTLTQDVTVSN